MPIVQRRSKPVNGSVVAFVAGAVAVGVVLVVVVAGAVVLFGLLLSFDGNVPADGVGVVEAGVVEAGVVVGGVVGVWP
jgi:hypothetical protein